MAVSPLERIKAILAGLGIEPSVAQADSLRRYCEGIIAANSEANLTGAKDVAGFIAGPLFDALTIVPVLARTVNLVDVGSGGGLPGIPIAILNPSVDLTLVEPRGKRVSFLQEMTRTLGVRTEIIGTQDREIPEGTFQAAVSQAVFPPRKWLARGRRLVEDGGYVHVLSSVPLDEATLPKGGSIERQETFERELDGARRFASRVRIMKGRGTTRPNR